MEADATVVVECMDLDSDLVQIAMKTCLPGEPTLMVDTHLGTLLQDFLEDLQQWLKIREGERPRLTFSFKTLREDQSP